MNSLKTDRPNKAWCADITYIPLKDGFGYCVAVMDLKCEDVYLKGYERLNEARESITKYFDFYNQQRSHQALKNQTPIVMHFGGRG